MNLDITDLTFHRGLAASSTPSSLFRPPLLGAGDPGLVGQR
ncbi:MAG: hypothetical protein U0470_00115 [Anaerolineae bacterium]